MREYLLRLRDMDKEAISIKARLKEIQATRKQLETEVIRYIQERDEPGLRYRDIHVILQYRKKRPYVPKQERHQKLIHYLQERGTPNDENNAEELLETLRGESYSEPILKLFY